MRLIIPTLYRYFKFQKIIKKIAEIEELQSNLSKLFGAKFETDWAGRMWVVLNPYVQDMNDGIGHNNSVTNVFQYNKDGSMSNSYAIERWVMDRMNIANEFIANHNLFEILTYKIDKLDVDNNYLFVIQNIMFDDAKDVIKRLLIMVPVLGVIAFVLFKFLIF